MEDERDELEQAGGTQAGPGDDVVEDDGAAEGEPEGAGAGEAEPESSSEVAELRGQVKQLTELVRAQLNGNGSRRADQQIYDETFGRGARRSAPADGDPEFEEWQQTYARLAASKRPSHRMMVALMDEVRELKGQLRSVDDRARTRIPPEDEEMVERYMRSGHFNSRAAAHRAVRAAKLEAENRELRAKLNGGGNGAAKTPTRPSPERKPIGTSTRGVPASEARDRGFIPRAKFDEVMERSTSGSRADMDAAIELQEKVRAGAVKLKG